VRGNVSNAEAKFNGVYGMVCRNSEFHVPVLWDDDSVYGFVEEPTERQNDLINAVNQLPPVCRKVAILYAFERMQREEIAATMTLSLATTRFLIHRSGLLLHQYLAQKEKQDLLVRQNALNTTLSDWPYLEYAQLVELRKDMMFFA
jgi:hypothetical protein